MVLKLLHIYCYPSKYSWNFTDSLFCTDNHYRFKNSMFFKRSQRQTCYYLFCLPRDSSLWPPRLYPSTPWPNSYFCCVCFSTTPSLIFFPFLSFLAFDIAEAYFLLPSIASEGILLLLLSQNDRSHPVFCNLQCLLILLSYFCHWWLFCTSIFSTFIVPDNGRCLWLKAGEGSASKSKYHFMFILFLIHSLFCFQLIFKVQYRCSYQLPNSCIRSLKDSRRGNLWTKQISKISASVETKTSRPFSINA